MIYLRITAIAGNALQPLHRAGSSRGAGAREMGEPLRGWGCCRERPWGAVGHPVLAAAFPLRPLRRIRAKNKIHPRRAAPWGFRRLQRSARGRQEGLGG